MYGNSYGQLEIARGDTLGMGEFGELEIAQNLEGYGDFGELEIAQNFEGYGDFGNPFRNMNFGFGSGKLARRRRARIKKRCKRKIARITRRIKRIEARSQNKDGFGGHDYNEGYEGYMEMVQTPGPVRTGIYAAAGAAISHMFVKGTKKKKGQAAIFGAGAGALLAMFMGGEQ
jgi:hypothetical protein